LKPTLVPAAQLATGKCGSHLAADVPGVCDLTCLKGRTAW